MGNYPKTSPVVVDLYAASDRNNYGDLLFPLLVKKYVEVNHKEWEVRSYAATNSDLSSFGALKTRSIACYRKDIQDGKRHLLCVAGGDVLDASWLALISYHRRFRAAYRLCKYLNKLMGPRIVSHLLSFLFRFPAVMPFAVSDNDIRGVQVVYNAVGGSRLRNMALRATVIEKLRHVTYLSVRDRETNDFLREHEVPKVRLTPDSAFIISDFFPRNKLTSLVSRNAAGFIKRKPKYFCFQSGQSFFEGNAEAAADSIIFLCKKYSLKCVLFSIGTAMMHNDDVTVRTLASLERLKPYIKIIEPKNIWDIMALIAHGQFYVGTSLHGAITALTYNRLAIGLCSERVIKMKEMINTWAPKNSAICATYETFGQSAEALLKAKKNWQKIESVKKQVYANFAQMFHI